MIDQKQVLALLLFVFVVGCASSPPKSLSSNHKGESVQSEKSDLLPSSDEDSLPEEIEPKSEMASEPVRNQTLPDGSDLAEAIKSNNDEAIYRTAIQILSKNSGDLKALNALGLYHYRKGHLPAAQLMFARALKLSPNSSEIHNNLGLVSLAQNEKRTAIKEFRKSLELNPSDSTAAANLASIYVEDQDYTKALVASEIAYRKNSKDQRVLNNYAISLTAAGKFPEAQDLYKQALKLNENNKDVLFNYAFLLIEKLNQNQDGLDLLNKVKFLGPAPEIRNKINVLENKAKAGLK